MTYESCANEFKNQQGISINSWLIKVRLSVFLLDLLGCSLSVLAKNWYGSVCALHKNAYFI